MNEEKTVQHSKKFEAVRDWYDCGLWNRKRVKNAVAKGWITDEEYEEITGDAYDA